MPWRFSRFALDLFVGAPIDLTDFDVESNDGEHIGKVDEATYDSEINCLVVDTGHWIFGKQRLVPAGVVTRVEPEANKVFISMTKDQVKQAPDHDHERHRRPTSATTTSTSAATTTRTAGTARPRRASTTRKRTDSRTAHSGSCSGAAPARRAPQQPEATSVG